MNHDHVAYDAGTFAFSGRVNGAIASTFNTIAFGSRGLHKDLTLDFSRISKAYANAMVTLVLSCRVLRRKHRVHVLLPEADYLGRLFQNAAWAHFLSPDQYEHRERVFDRHIPLNGFQTNTEQAQLVKRTMDVVLSNVRLGKHLAIGFDWLLQEMTDNVLCHADTPDGGLLQLVNQHAFLHVIIADAGRGIPATMRDMKVALDDCAAVEQSTWQGVTSKPSTNQGNGLAGTRNVAVASGGQLSIVSGRANVWWDKDGVHHKRLPYDYAGTVIDINLGKQFFDSREALALGGAEYQPEGHFEFEYWKDDAQAFCLRLSKEPGGVASRQSGKALACKIVNILEHDSSASVVVDWHGIDRVPSSSFVDEAFAKLRIELGADLFRERIRHKNDSDDIRWAILTAYSRRPA